MHRGAGGGNGVGAARHDGGQVGRGGAAAPADDGHAELGDEAVQVLRQVLRCEVVVHQAVDHRREARIRDAGDGDAAGPRKVAQRLAHLDRARGAVEADHVDLHRIEHGQRRADLGAGQHAAGQLNGHLRLQRDVAVQRHHGAPGAVHRGLDRQHVELRLNQQQVDAALEQPERLLLVGLTELGVRDVPERGELRAGAHGARHPARPLGRRELVTDGAGQLGGPAGDLAGAIGQPVLGQDDRGGAEGVGLDHVAADLVEGAVHLRHDVGPGLHEPLVAPLEVRPAEVVRAEPQHLQVGPHGAVEDEHALSAAPADRWRRTGRAGRGAQARELPPTQDTGGPPGSPNGPR